MKESEISGEQVSHVGLMNTPSSVTFAPRFKKWSVTGEQTKR